MTRPMWVTVVLLLGVLAGSAPERLQAQAQAQTRPEPFIFEYYYKVKWGSLDEFMALYQKNHYPILQRLQQMGHILEMSAAYPVNHAGEEKRWDFRFTIVYRDAATAHARTSEALIRELYPDQATFKKEEQRRFELLLEHMDVPIRLEDLKTWR